MIRPGLSPRAARQASHLVLERRQALLAHQAATGLEPVAQEVETPARLTAVADPCLVWMERQV